MEFVYDLTVDPDAENNTHAFASAMIGHNKRVLEVGCATGYFTKVLAECGCKVVGMELDPEAALVAEEWTERVVVGNVDDPGVWEAVDDESFDVVTFGDVLEHLRDPLAVLRAAVRKLKPSGFIVSSLPNVAHGDVRLSLLHGSFQYGETGLLDRTHMRFFTLQTIRELLHDAGLVVVDTQRVVMPLFHTELGVQREEYPEAVVEEIQADKEFETYQFVMKSVIDNGSAAVESMAERLEEADGPGPRARGEQPTARGQGDGVCGDEGRVRAPGRAGSHVRRSHRGSHRAGCRAARGDATKASQAEDLEKTIASLSGALEESQRAHADSERARAESERARAEIERARAESARQYDEIRNSRSFRMTAPLRRLGALVRGNRTP